MNDEEVGEDAVHQEEAGAPAPSSHAPQPLTDSTGADNESGMEALLRDSEYAFRSLRRGETVEGTVVRVDQDEVLVDVGMKSEGVIPARELFAEGEDVPPLQIGDRTLVYVLQPEGSEGHAILSLRRARMERSWREIEELYNHGAIIEAPVVDFNKGGLIVDVRSVRGFVPVSQVLDLRNVTRQDGENEEVTQTLAAMNGRRLPLKIIEINRSRNRLILSERAAVQEQRTQRKDELLDQLEPGQIRRGVVSNLTSFGAFIDLGGADGLVHVSELSYNRVNHPSEILRVGQEIDVMVLSIDRDSKKIALSLKRALPDPWTTVEQRYRVGEVVPATITKLAKFGAFAKVEEGLEGLIHLSELTDLPVQDAAQVVREGDQLRVKIIHINSQRRRLGLSVRQAGERLPGVQSFGEVEGTTPFSASQLESLQQAEPAAEPIAQVEEPVPVEGEPVTEPAAKTASTDEPPAVETPVPASPVEAEAVEEPIPSDDELESAAAPAEDTTDESASAPSEEDQTAPSDSSSPSPEGELITGEQRSPAAELEPQTPPAEADGSAAGVSEEAPSASSEAPLSTNQDEQTEVASGVQQGTA